MEQRLCLHSGAMAGLIIQLLQDAHGVYVSLYREFPIFSSAVPPMATARAYDEKIL
jgi:hypothetical protein